MLMNNKLIRKVINVGDKGYINKDKLNLRKNFNDNNLKGYFSGEKLYGDDFSKKQIKEWFEDEKEGYSGLEEVKNYIYQFYVLNTIHGYNKIEHIKEFKKVLSFGGAKGDELLPVIDKIGQIYIIEPSMRLRIKEIRGKSIKYMTPNINGRIKFKDNFFDLITCFGTLHHIPNVSFVLKEIVRVLKPKGFLLLREPIVSMGDWRKPRKGLTKRERGIPLHILRKNIRENNFEVISEKKVLFPLLRRINFGKYIGGNSKFWVYVDSILSNLFSWNYRYHAKDIFQKLQPQSVFYVLRKK